MEWERRMSWRQAKKARSSRARRRGYYEYQWRRYLACNTSRPAGTRSEWDMGSECGTMTKHPIVPTWPRRPPRTTRQHPMLMDLLSLAMLKLTDDIPRPGVLISCPYLKTYFGTDPHLLVVDQIRHGTDLLPLQAELDQLRKSSVSNAVSREPARSGL